MSLAVIKKALEKHLMLVSQGFATAWENVAFKPSADTPWQRVYVMPAANSNPTMGGDFYRGRGILQVTLNYPEGHGAAASIERADAICAHFKRGTAFIDGGVHVNILQSPSIGGANSGGGWYRLVVTVPYIANVYL